MNSLINTFKDYDLTPYSQFPGSTFAERKRNALKYHDR